MIKRRLPVKLQELRGPRGHPHPGHRGPSAEAQAPATALTGRAPTWASAPPGHTPAHGRPAPPPAARSPAHPQAAFPTRSNATPRPGPPSVWAAPHDRTRPTRRILLADTPRSVGRTARGDVRPGALGDRPRGAPSRSALTPGPAPTAGGRRARTPEPQASPARNTRPSPATAEPPVSYLTDCGGNSALRHSRQPLQKGPSSAGRRARAGGCRRPPHLPRPPRRARDSSRASPPRGGPPPPAPPRSGQGWAPGGPRR